MMKQPWGHSINLSYGSFGTAIDDRMNSIDDSIDGRWVIHRSINQSSVHRSIGNTRRPSDRSIDYSFE